MSSIEQTDPIRRPTIIDFAQKRATYYPDGEAKEAVMLFLRLLPHTETAMFDFIKSVKGNQDSQSFQNRWLGRFSEHISQPFLADHPHITHEILNLHTGKQPYPLISAIHAYLRESYTPDAPLPIQPGWKAFLYEYGIGSFFPEKIAEVWNQMVTLKPYELTNISILQELTDDEFKAPFMRELTHLPEYRVYCPGHGMAQYVAWATVLNLGLVRLRLWSPDTSISFLSKETSHFKPLAEMSNAYLIHTKKPRT